MENSQLFRARNQRHSREYEHRGPREPYQRDLHEIKEPNIYEHIEFHGFNGLFSVKAEGVPRDERTFRTLEAAMRFRDKIYAKATAHE